MEVDVSLGNCVFFLQIFKNKSPDYLSRTIPQRRSSYITRNSDKIPLFNANHNFYKNLFFPSTTIECNNLSQDLRNSESYTLFLSNLVKFIRQSPNSFNDCQNIMGIKLVTRLRVGLSHLWEHKFKHSVSDTLNPFCNCRMYAELSKHFLLQYPSYINKRRTLRRNLNIINPQISQTSFQSDSTLLFRSWSYSHKGNTYILDATIDQIQLTKIFQFLLEIPIPIFQFICFSIIFWDLAWILFYSTLIINV